MGANHDCLNIPHERTRNDCGFLSLRARVCSTVDITDGTAGSVTYLEYQPEDMLVLFGELVAQVYLSSAPYLQFQEYSGLKTLPPASYSMVVI